VSVIELTGPGAVLCLQGVLTNDVEAAGPGGVLYGAVLTPKGMIVCDLWANRHADAIWIYASRSGTAALFEVFKKFFPPRLAATRDRTAEYVVLRLLGPESLRAAVQAGFDPPEAGYSASATIEDTDIIVSRPPDGGYFTLQLQVPVEQEEMITARLRDAGLLMGNATSLELARISWGWPELGVEIGEKTLPQEVRFDALNGVSYTKGCYTGQETVARLHFRGHSNRQLHGLMWEDSPNREASSIQQADKVVGRVTSIAWMPPLGQYIGLGFIHRKADLDAPFVAADAPAVIVDLPHGMDA
jgi:folate-binding protein YgfZ